MTNEQKRATVTSAKDFLTAFAKAIIHNVDTRPQIVQGWTGKLEARETELKKEGSDIALDVMIFHLMDKADMVSRDSLIDLIRREKAALK